MAERDRFAAPPPEVVRYVKAKGLEPSEHWLDTAFDAHALSFTVARSAGYDILGDVRDALVKAMAGRQEFADCQKGLEPLLKARGWWGKTPEGVQLGSPRRLRTIYWANVRTAHAAGQWERVQATKRVLPYMVYVISTALKRRELHLQWVGTALPVDDPWWDTHYPPNGWNCKCRVRQISQYELDNSGYSTQAPDDGEVSFTNKRTGEVIKVPQGIDPGWGGNPGKVRMQNAAIDPADPVTSADIGATVFMTDDNTVSRTNPGGNTKSAAGLLLDVDANSAWVKI